MSAIAVTTYPEIAMWQPRTWVDRFSSMIPLAERIELENYESRRRQVDVGTFDDRADGIYTAKTRSVTYPDIVDAWAAKGLTYVCDEMAQVNWIVMLPEGIAQASVNRRTLLVVLHDAEYANRNWAMDTVERYTSHNEFAAESGCVLLYIVNDRPDYSNAWVNIIQEIAVRFHLDYDHVFLDVSPLWRSGVRLQDITDFRYCDDSGAVVAPPDDAIEELDGFPVLDISGRWQNRVSQMYRNAVTEAHLHPDFDLDAMVHSETGRAMAQAMEIEYRFSGVTDPALIEFLHDRGVTLARHVTAHQQWISLTPTGAVTDNSLPLTLVFQEVTELDPFQPLSALSSFYGFVDLVGRGEMACLFFALETPDDNDLAVPIIERACQVFPIDRTRIYVTGHSHNGHFAREFARRHPDIVAALAQLGNHYGLPAPAYSREVVKVTDDMLESMRGIDMPTVVIGADSEGDYLRAEPGTAAFANAVDAWSRRAVASHFEPASAAQIAAQRTTDDPVSRVVGLPGQRREVRDVLGARCDLVDLDDSDGHFRLRLVAIENMIHMCVPPMPALMWDFCRRFARDPESGAVIELEL